MGQPLLTLLVTLFTLIAPCIASAQPGPTDPTPPAGAADVSEAHEGDDGPTLTLSVFADAFYAINSQGNAYALTDGAENHRSYVFNEGFQLAWAGLDAAYGDDSFGVVLSLRTGSGAVRYFDGGAPIVDFVSQAYVSWAITDSLTLDVGQFDTIYGAEVAKSWANPNYTRGAVYFAIQPFFHVGGKLGWQMTDVISLTAIAVNGVNALTDDDATPDVGIQLGVETGGFTLAAGYLLDTDHQPGELAEHLVDVVLGYEAGVFSVVANADLGASDDANFYGLSVAPSFRVDDHFGFGLRGEILGFPDATPADFTGPETAAYDGLMTLTGTVDVRPTGDDRFMIRPEFRYERASGADAFADADGAPTDAWWTFVIGFTATTESE